MPQSLTLPLGAQERQRGAQTRRPLTVELPVSSSLRPNPTGGPHRRARWRAFGPFSGLYCAKSPSLVPAGEAAAGDAVAGRLYAIAGGVRPAVSGFVDLGVDDAASDRDGMAAEAGIERLFAGRSGNLAGACSRRPRLGAGSRPRAR